MCLSSIQQYLVYNPRALLSSRSTLFQCWQCVFLLFWLEGLGFFKLQIINASVKQPLCALKSKASCLSGAPNFITKECLSPVENRSAVQCSVGGPCSKWLCVAS